jgi:integrase
VWDDGFGVRQTETGATSFILSYFLNHKNHRYTIGKASKWSVEAARKEAKRLEIELIAKGDDPLAKRNERINEPTFKQVADGWLKYAVGREKPKRPASLYNDRQKLDKIILPAFGEKRISEITSLDVKRLHGSLKKRAPYHANRVVALLSSIFNFALDESNQAEWLEGLNIARWLTKNPAKMKRADRCEETQRECWLTVEQFQRLREAMDKLKDQSAANALKMLTLTGSRKAEVLKATWEQFDLQRGIWTKPAHTTKQDKIEHVPLSIPALKLLESMAPENPTGPLFPSRRAKGSHIAIDHAWRTACRIAGVEKVVVGDNERKLRIHDLRHNYCSHLVSSGVSLQIVGKLVGHTKADTTMRYAHLLDAPLRDATNAFGNIYANKLKTAKRSA